MVLCTWEELRHQEIRGGRVAKFETKKKFFSKLKNLYEDFLDYLKLIFFTKISEIYHLIIKENTKSY